MRLAPWAHLVVYGHPTCPYCGQKVEPDSITSASGDYTRLTEVEVRDDMAYCDLCEEVFERRTVVQYGVFVEDVSEQLLHALSRED